MIYFILLLENKVSNECRISCPTEPAPIIPILKADKLAACFFLTVIRLSLQ